MVKVAFVGLNIFKFFLLKMLFKINVIFLNFLLKTMFNKNVIAIIKNKFIENDFQKPAILAETLFLKNIVKFNLRKLFLLKMLLLLPTIF